MTIEDDFLDSIRSCNYEALEAILSKDDVKLHLLPPVNKDENALQWAIFNNDLRMARILLEHDASPSDRVGQGYTPIAMAAVREKSDSLRLLLEYSQSYHLRARNNYGCSPLHLAVDHGTREAVELLLEHGAEVDGIDHKGESPLHYAAYRGSVEMTELLDSKGASWGIWNQSNNGARAIARRLSETTPAHSANAKLVEECADRWFAKQTGGGTQTPSPVPAPEIVQQKAPTRGSLRGLFGRKR